jgi:hypothetical protein
VKTRAALSTTGVGAGPAAGAATPGSAIPIKIPIRASTPATNGSFLIGSLLGFFFGPFGLSG